MDQILKSLSDELAATVEKASPGVARVEGRRRLPASGIVWSADGVVVTAHHVLEQDEDISVGLNGREAVPATLVGRDPTTDLAVLRVSDAGPIAAELNGVDGLSVGHLVLALARPGAAPSATLGIVSAIGSGWRTPAGGRLDTYLQTDVAMLPGFSGGPLVSAEGKVLGMNTSALARGSSITVPVATIRRVAQTLIEHGRVRRGYLGIGAQPVRLPEALEQELGQESALLVISVDSGSSADQAGLLLGDVIVAVDGQPVRHLQDLLALLSTELVGRTVPIQLVRAGQTQERTVTVGERG